MTLSCVVSLQAKELDSTPIITNFSNEIFDIESKVWDVDQDENGIIYAATNAGLYEYDGERWKLHQGGIGTNLRSVLCHEDIIYTSGWGGYGYWDYDVNLRFIYHSLYIQPNTEGVSTEEFWNIELTPKALFFQSKNRLHIYDRESGVVSIHTSSKGFDNLHKTEDGRLYVRDLDRGVCLYQGDSLHLLPGTSQLALSLSAIFSIGKSLYFVSAQRGILTYTDQRLEAVNWEIDPILKGEKVFSVTTDSHYGILIGTVRHGLYLLDFNGRVIKHYNKKKGLQGNTILSVLVDKSNDIWLGIDGGISYVQESSPLQIVIDKQEDIGSVYSAVKHDDKIYLASNQGLFSLTRNNYSFSLDLIEGSVGQAWAIDEIDGQIFVGHHNGAFLLNDNKLEQMSDVTGVWHFIQSPKDKNLVIAGSYHGLSLYRKVGEKWLFVDLIKGFEESSRFLSFDRYGYLWVAHPVKGYYRISLNKNHLSCEEVKFFAPEKYALVEPLYFSNIDEGLVFYNRNGVYKYNLLEESFDTHSYFNHINTDNLPMTSLTQVGNYFWYVAYNTLKCVERRGKDIILHNQPLYMLDNHLLGDFTSIVPLDNHQVIVGLRDGIALIDSRNMKSESSIPLLILREIEQIGIAGKQNVKLDSENSISLANKYGNIRFYFASPTELKYSYSIQYKLTKYQEEWSDLSSDSYVDLIGLSAGEYHLSVRAKDRNENNSPELSFTIKVAQPFYLRKWLIAVYVLSIIGITVVLALFFRKRAVNKALKVKREESIMLELKLEQVEKKALQIEKEKMVLEENQLKLELDRINNELISTSMNNVKKNDLLMDLRQSVISINNISQNPKVISYSTKIASKIDRMLNSHEDWITFELHFKNAHQGFFDRITLKHPGLSPNDLKLCAYLRLNLSTKEISSLINISPRSVEVARYRLRQKLQLPKSENLIKYILEI